MQRKMDDFKLNPEILISSPCSSFLKKPLGMLFLLLFISGFCSRHGYFLSFFTGMGS